MSPENTRAAPLTSTADKALMFPTLSSAQIARIASRGVIRPITRGEVLIEGGQTNVPFFVLKAGEIEVVRPSGLGDLLVAVLSPAQFTGDISMILGRPAQMRIRVSGSGEVVQLTRDQMHALIQTDAEIGEVLMRALIYRRVELVAQGVGDVLLIGSTRSASTLRIKQFLTRNGHPFKYLDLDHDSDVQHLLDRFHVDPAEIPVMICRGEAALKNPSNETIAERLGFNERIDRHHLRDVVIVGAGPAGLAAAVYAASEGLDALVIEASSPGGQAGSSSKIENYLGFPTGISGQELAGRAFAQAQKFGAAVMIAKSAAELTCEHMPYGVRLDDGATVPARTVIIATGARYRKPALANLERFEGAGVYYTATFMEKAQIGDGDEVVVVGGANSAGQAAVFLAQTARRVHVLVRSHSLSESMSRYLVRRIEETPTIELRTKTEIVALEGDGHLERVQWRDGTGAVTSHEIKHVFLMTGADANTGWLGGCVALDANGFIKTGPDLTRDGLAAARWPLERSPYLLETSRPGVFAAGDVRGGNIKRVASAVGEGSIAISFVHRVLAESS
ncbi:MAG TPA: FAD-dependent oxidoreductase [Vicinamibacterales bacterium]|jgi:thioredoxin reductase (NADPH)|nr:FAD-dependent oxidoreductase [Vicinamibacterales bacterium]